jgi:hypothetical protein
MNPLLYGYILLEMKNYLKINAPTFIYKILYNKLPTFFIIGRVNHKTKIINNILIDKNIPTNVIKDLMNIPEIEMRSSCEGNDKNRPSYIIFRSINQEKDFVNSLENNLNQQKNIKAKAEIGNNNFYRIGVTYFTWYGKTGNNKWWKMLPMKIKSSIKLASN